MLSLRSHIRSVAVRVARYAAPLYHFWYYHAHQWDALTWMGVPVHKLPLDMWNYQEILTTLRPALIVEFGTFQGGSALFFAMVMRQIGKSFRILSVDIDGSLIQTAAKADPNIELLQASSADPLVARRIADLKLGYPGPVFVILDSDHSKNHVLAEMELLRPLLQSGDYLVVEDSNINGHPVFKSFGPGPYEAVKEYFEQFPNDYVHDSQRDSKFGLTYAPQGFLIRK